MLTSSEKDASIETLRGLAIIFMVAGHVVGDDASAGMRVADDSPLRHFYYSLEFMRLPLFTAISGFVYAMRPVSRLRDVRPFLRGKMRRLLLPMATVGTVEFLLRWSAPGTNHSVALSDIWQIYVTGFDHFWFLQAVFSVFVVVALLEGLRATRSERGFLAVLGACCAASFFVPTTGVFSLNGAVYLLPYLVLGVGLYRFDRLRASWLVSMAACVFVTAVAYQQWTWASPGAPLLERTGIIAMAIGFSGMLLFFRFRPRVAPIARIGFYAYGIYLFHVFGTAPARTLAQKLGAPDAAVFFISLAVGLGLPVLIEHMLLRSSWLSLCFLGLRPKPAVGERARSSSTPVPTLRISRPPS